MNFEAILFDCDGVLVDSEAITCGVLRDMFEEQGWRMTLAECMQRFVGHTVKSQRSVIEAHTGQLLTDAWLEQFFARRNERLTQSITAIEGVHEAVAHLHDHCQGRIAVASGADRFKVEMMLKQVGLIQFFEGRMSITGKSNSRLSAVRRAVSLRNPRSKPHPDVYLAAAAHLQIDPARCLVVEDTTVGITAGVAAGATVWAYAPPGADAQALRQAGAAQVFEHMRGLRLG
uniref:HAD family hydrolase n=1 Tax=Limnohabitans sp. TaxID=1907725 RepID=UPI004047902E